MAGCSVVVAACNGERFIAQQIQSILQQLGHDDELVICDDGSTDITVAAVEQIRDCRIRLFKNHKRAGYIKNFEKAVLLANGSDIFFSDQDDVWLPGKIELMRKALQEKSFVASDAVVVDECLNVLHKSYFQFRGANRFTWFSILRKPPIIGATMACRRDYLLAMMPFPVGVPHDFWLSFNAAWDMQLSVLQEPLLLYRRHSGAVSPTAKREKRLWRIVVLERLRLLLIFLYRRSFR